MPTSKLKNKIIGITLGDPAGIGPEVTAKALAKLPAQNNAFMVIGDGIIFDRYFARRPKNSFFLNMGHGLPKYKPGQPTTETAKASLDYLDTAIRLLKNKKISALVTGPVSKEGICSLGYDFHGHTEYIAQAFKIKKFGMMFVSPKLRTLIVTRHIPVSKVSKALTIQNILGTIVLSHDVLKNYFKIPNPRIGVCGFNPHAGEGGTIGREEMQTIIPAIKKAKENGMTIQGPLAADTLFIPTRIKDFDVIVAMYHDQGLIPIKTLYFHQLVNLTVGLPFVRTSPAHGTAFDIAGKNKADASSMLAAINLSMKLSQ